MTPILRASSALVFAVAFSAMAAMGCGSADYDHTDIQNVRPSPLGGNMNYARIVVPVGMIVTAHIVSYDDDRKTMDMDVTPKDTGIVEVSGIVSDHDFAFYGLKTGETDVVLKAAGKVVLILSAKVVDQPPAP